MISSLFPRFLYIV